MIIIIFSHAAEAVFTLKHMECFIHYSNVDQKLPPTQLSETSFLKLNSSPKRWTTPNCIGSEISSSCNDIWTKSFDQISSSYKYNRSCYRRFTNTKNMKCKEVKNELFSATPVEMQTCLEQHCDHPSAVEHPSRSTSTTESNQACCDLLIPTNTCCLI